MKYFDRKVEVIIGKMKFSGDELDIDFEVPFDDDTEPNEASVEIYNLSNNTANNLKKGAEILIKAGYKEDFGIIFAGRVSAISTKWSGVDKTTSVKAVDSEISGTKSVNKTYKSAQARYILQDLAAMTGLGIGRINVGDKSYDKYVADGPILDVMKKIARECGCKCYTNRSRIYVIPPNEGTGSTFVISPTTGLIETPEYFEKEEEVKENDSVNQSASSQPLTDEQYDALTESKKMVRGYNVKSLLQHQISTSSSVRVESSSLNGSFKVKKGKHTCNGSSYYTEMEVII